MRLGEVAGWRAAVARFTQIAGGEKGMRCVRILISRVWVLGWYMQEACDSERVHDRSGRRCGEVFTHRTCSGEGLSYVTLTADEPTLRLGRSPRLLVRSSGRVRTILNFYGWPWIVRR